MHAKSALLVVDMQNDFCPGGALPVPDGDAIVASVNEYLELFAREQLPVFASRDWHPEETSHFASSGGQWPRHCVRHTPGAAFHPAVQFPSGTVVLTKGAEPDQDGYSAFEGADESGGTFEELLRAQSVTRLYVCGLATDQCVKHSVLDALKRTFRVSVLKDAVRGVEREEGDSRRALELMQENGAEMITHAHVVKRFLEQAWLFEAARGGG
ncbi:MAG: bifunctional nicotinamidase/pyrazinamidase [Chitinivibrionales bacterium]|nr:bifunctional nicotinamidase/pyrazinamidase [Chitinivibrionales bacterium]MBD3395297.1 bifunctional nicotinamidase/pyrazinamidase [Chitinivibrionales bacterium]